MSVSDANNTSWTALRTATVHFADAQIQRAWAISSAHQCGLSIRRIAAATDLSPSRVHQVLNSAETTDMPAWPSRLRETDEFQGDDETKPSSPAAEMCRRLGDRGKGFCDAVSIGWDGWNAVKAWWSISGSTRLQKPNTSRLIVRVLCASWSIASDLEGLATGGQPDRLKKDRTIQQFATSGQLAELQKQPKKLSTHDDLGNSLPGHLASALALPVLRQNVQANRTDPSLSPHLVK